MDTLANIFMHVRDDRTMPYRWFRSVCGDRGAKDGSLGVECREDFQASLIWN